MQFINPFAPLPSATDTGGFSGTDMPDMATDTSVNTAPARVSQFKAPKLFKEEQAYFDEAINAGVDEKEVRITLNKNRERYGRIKFSPEELNILHASQEAGDTVEQGMKKINEYRGKATRKAYENAPLSAKIAKNAIDLGASAVRETGEKTMGALAGVSSLVGADKLAKSFQEEANVYKGYAPEMSQTLGGKTGELTANVGMAVGAMGPKAFTNVGTKFIPNAIQGGIAGARLGAAENLASEGENATVGGVASSAGKSALIGGALQGGLVKGLEYVSGKAAGVPIRQAIKSDIQGTGQAIREGVDTALNTPVGRQVAKVGSVVTSPVKSIINTAKQYAGSPDEIAGIQSAIRPKQVVRNGVNLRPQSQIEDEIALTNSLIRGSGQKPQDLVGYRDAIKKQMVSIGDEINRLTGQDLSLSIPETALKLRELANSQSVRMLDEAGAKRLSNLADQIENRKFSVAEAEEMNQFINAMLRNKNIDASESYQQGLNIIVEGLRKGLDDTISQIPGEFKQLKKSYGALRNIYGDTVSREIVENRKALSGLYESFGAIEGFSNVASGLGKILTGSPGAGMADIGKGLAQNAVGRFVQDKNNPNNIIKAVFAKEGKKASMPTIRPRETPMLPAPKKGAKQSEVYAPIVGKKSNAELSRESMKELKQKVYVGNNSRRPSVDNSVRNNGVQAKPEVSPLKSKGGYINPSEIGKSVKGAVAKGKEIGKTVLKSAMSANQEARQFYDDLIKAGNSPIVAQRETAKRFGTIRAMSASKAGTLDFSKEVPKKAMEEAKKYKSADEFIKSANTSNPTGKIFTEYTPEKRVNIPLGEGVDTLDKLSGGSPDEIITIYRGGGDKINNGDFVTTNKQLAKHYAGTGKVHELKVRKGDVISDVEEWEGEEYIYRIQADKEPRYTSSQLKQIYEQAHQKTKLSPKK